MPKSLRDYPAVAKLADAILQEGLSVRVKFLMRSCFATGIMIRDMEMIQAALLHGVHPGSLATGYDLEPENIKNLMLSVVRVSFLAIQKYLAPKIAERSGDLDLPANMPSRFLDYVDSETE